MTGMRRFFLLGIVFFTFQFSFAQKAKYHGQVIYRLTNHIRWASFNSDYKFVIGVVGNRNDFQYFQSVASKKDLILNRPVEVRYFKCMDDIQGCDLIYISEDCQLEFKRILERIHNQPVLIVSGAQGYGKAGSIINFVDKEGKITFELNQKQAELRGLFLSDALKNLAILI
jgi:hypothetical protein